MTEDTFNLETSVSPPNEDGNAFFTYVDANADIKEEPSLKENDLTTDEKCNNMKPGTKSPENFSWPSLWKNGPRRSAFQPYKPSRDAAPSSSRPRANRVSESSEESLSQSPQPRPASTTVMTNLQRGNIQASPAPNTQNISWFMLAGRGDITADTLQLMIAQGKDIDCADEEGLSALMWAAFYGQIHTVQILLDTNKIEVDREGMWGETALMLAATEGHLEIIRLLINAGADVDHEDHNGSTALMNAAQNDHPHTVNELLHVGADLWIENCDNSSAYDMAVDNKSLRSKAVMEKYMSSLLTGS